MPAGALIMQAENTAHIFKGSVRSLKVSILHITI